MEILGWFGVNFRVKDEFNRKFLTDINFRHLMSRVARNFLNFLPRAPHAMTRYLDKFRDFRTLFGFYIILKHVSRK